MNRYIVTMTTTKGDVCKMIANDGTTFEDISRVRSSFIASHGQEVDIKIEKMRKEK